MDYSQAQADSGQSPVSVGVRGIAYFFDETVPIEETPELAADSALLEKFKSAGFAYFTRSKSLVRQAFVAALQTLTKSNMKPTDIDAVVIGTGGLHHLGQNFEGLSEKILCALQIKQAQVVGVTTGGCANIASSIRVAKNMILAEGYRNVLVIETNLSSRSRYRVVVTDDQASQVMGDGAVSLVVTRTKPDYVIAGMDQAALPIAEINPEMAVRAANKVLGSRRVIGRVLEQACISREQLSKVFLPNVRIQALYGFSHTHQLPGNLLYLDNIARTGHIWSADPLISMADFCAKEAPSAGSYFLTYSFGIRYFSAILFQKT